MAEVVKMPDLLSAIQSRLNAGDLRKSLTLLFCETLRWGHPQGNPLTLSVGAPVNRSLTFVPIAQLRAPNKTRFG